jgi:hypothetical protein
MPNKMALRYLLSLGIMGTTPLMTTEQVVAKSTPIVPDLSIAQGDMSRYEPGHQSSPFSLKASSSKTVVSLPLAALVVDRGQAPDSGQINYPDGLSNPVSAVAGKTVPWEEGLASTPSATSPMSISLENEVSPLPPNGKLALPIDENPENPAELSSEVPLPEQESLAFPLVDGNGVLPMSLTDGDGVPPLTNADVSVPLSAEDKSPPSETEGFADSVGTVPPLLTPAERSEVFTQAAMLQQGDAFSARLRGGAIYGLSPSVLVGATVDLTSGEAFSDTEETGFSLNELYLTASPANLPELRFSVGLLDLTSYLDRNSFAKDSVTQFFNPVFQTNPALSTVNVASRPAALVHWTPVDELSLTAVTYSSQRDLGDFALDSFAGEVGLRMGNAILRGTYATSQEDEQGDGFQEIFSVDRGNGQFGPLPGDREESFGLNGEVFIPEIKLGLFGRYGWYTNEDMGVSGQTFSLGVNGLDVFLPNDRLGLGYGRQLSNDDLRQANGGIMPDVWELFYDTEIVDRLRVGVSLQQRNAWTETYLGLRVRYDLRWNNIVREGES